MSRIAAILMLSAAALCGAADAKTKVQAVVVTGPPTMQQWAGRLSRSLSDGMRFPTAPLGQQIPSGYIKVRFHCSESGTPADISLFRKSGNRRLDEAAIRAVTRLKSLHPLPDGVGHDRIIEAHLFFADSPDNFADLLAAERRETLRTGPVLAVAGQLPVVLSNRPVTQGTN